MNDAIVLLDVEDGVATVTFNRPERLNALNAELARGLRGAVEQLEADAAIRCVILQGAGEHFMAGGDVHLFNASLPELAARESRLLRTLLGDVHATVRCLRRMPQPVIASVRGAAAGFGFSLLCACDLALAADDAKFTLAYCHLGTTPDGGATWLLPRLLGPKLAAELALLGERFGADRAFALGLINRVVPADALHTATRDLALRLTRGPAMAHARTKALLARAWETSFEVQLGAEEEAFAACAATADFAEGVRAFCEKRPPRFA